MVHLALLIAFNTVKLGHVAEARGDLATALASYREGQAIHEHLGTPREAQQMRDLIARAKAAAPPVPLDDQIAAQAAEDEPPGSPWLALAAYLRACAALLNGQPFARDGLEDEDLAQLDAWQRGEIQDDSSAAADISERPVS